MTNKDSKVPIYIAILIAVIMIAAGGYFLLGGTSKMTTEKIHDADKNTLVPTPKETSVSVKETTSEAAETTTKTIRETPASITAAPKVEKIKCELCHKNSQELIPHLNGGKLCVTCHGNQVHNIHIGPGTVGLPCDTCHGSPPNTPTIDTSGEGPGHYSVCENCHAGPDSLKPSFGDLVTIHFSRSKYCTDCHVKDIGVIHSAKMANTTNK
jgi:hypothetical protein